MKVYNSKVESESENKQPVFKGFPESINVQFKSESEISRIEKEEKKTQDDWMIPASLQRIFWKLTFIIQK